MNKFCSNCGKQLSDDEKFCGSCGNSVTNQSVVEPNINSDISLINTENLDVTDVNNTFKNTIKFGAIAITIVIICAVLFLNNQNSDELIKYINVDIVEVIEQEDKVLEVYNSVIGPEANVDDLTAYNTILNDVIPASLEWSRLVNEIEIEIENDEIKEIHNHLILYVDTMHNSFLIMLEALEDADYQLIAEVNNLQSEAARYLSDWEDSLNDLMLEYDVVWE